LFTELLGLKWGPANAEIDGYGYGDDDGDEDMEAIPTDRYHPKGGGISKIKKPPAVAFTCTAFAWKCRANFSAINRTAESDLETPPTNCILDFASCHLPPTSHLSCGIYVCTILARKPVAAHLHGGLIKTVCGWVMGWLGGFVGGFGHQLLPRFL